MRVMARPEHVKLRAEFQAKIDRLTRAKTVALANRDMRGAAWLQASIDRQQAALQTIPQ